MIINNRKIMLYNGNDFAAGAKYSIGTDKVKKAKEACKDLGFNPGSEEFAKCSLKKLKEQSE